MAERRRLSAPGVLDAQVKPMPADPKSFALAENVAGQWREVRKPGSVWNRSILRDFVIGYGPH